jgi:hypothetical protein
VEQTLKNKRLSTYVWKARGTEARSYASSRRLDLLDLLVKKGSSPRFRCEITS